MTALPGGLDTHFERVVEVLGGQALDFVFVDHWKDLYRTDLARLEAQAGLLREGTIVIADNCRVPGAPEYVQYMLSEMGKRDYHTSVIQSTVEYTTETDEVLVSEVKATASFLRSRSSKL